MRTTICLLVYSNCPDDKRHLRLNIRHLVLGLTALTIPSPNSLFLTIKPQDSGDYQRHMAYSTPKIHCVIPLHMPLLSWAAKINLFIKQSCQSIILNAKNRDSTTSPGKLSDAITTPSSRKHCLFPSWTILSYKLYFSPNSITNSPFVAHTALCSHEMTVPQNEHCARCIYYSRTSVPPDHLGSSSLSSLCLS